MTNLSPRVHPSAEFLHRGVPSIRNWSDAAASGNRCCSTPWEAGSQPAVKGGIVGNIPKWDEWDGESLARRFGETYRFFLCFVDVLMDPRSFEDFGWGEAAWLAFLHMYGMIQRCAQATTATLMEESIWTLQQLICALIWLDVGCVFASLWQ